MSMTSNELAAIRARNEERRNLHDVDLNRLQSAAQTATECSGYETRKGRGFADSCADIDALLAEIEVAPEPEPDRRSIHVCNECGSAFEAGHDTHTMRQCRDELVNQLAAERNALRALSEAVDEFKRAMEDANRA